MASYFKHLILLCMITYVLSENGTEYKDSCFEERNSIYPCSSTITGNVILMLFYGAILGGAAKLISDGAEMLLDLGFSPSIIGGVVLPILGAVPDCAIIVSSGMGDDAQNKLSIGMGTLAGSTVMLLTIAWSSSLIVSRCSLNKHGESIDGKGKGFNLTKMGMTPLPEVRSGIVIMLLTSLFYFVVQSADWKFGARNTGEQPKYVRDAALATFVLCLCGLAGYTIYSVFDSKRNERRARLHKEEMAQRHVLHALIVMANKQTFKSPKASRATTDVEDGDPDASKEEENEAISKKYFKAWHMKKGVRKHQEESDALLSDERSSAASSDDEGTPESDPEKEDSKLVMSAKCVVMLLSGVALVTVFSDPMCDVLAAMTNTNNMSYIPISSFYISFVITPFCSNASEFVSSLIFASKKTRENATMTFSQLFGAATMNNTMCLAVFMALVYFKDLKWYYGAEVMCIVIVQWIVGFISLARTYKVWMAIPVAVTYVFCIVLTWLLENQLHWK
eukprot:TCONS_00024625-protein